jgi:repressor LexA
MLEPLTASQARVLRFIEDYIGKWSNSPTCREICGQFGYKSPRAASDHLDALERKGHIYRNKLQSRGIRLAREIGIPLLGSISAGLPRDNQQLPADYLAIDPKAYGIGDRDHAFALRVSGDSMEGRHIFDGDMVLLESSVAPRHESIVAALIDNESTLKTFLRQEGRVWLRAENPRYRDLIPAEELRIQGVARAVIRRLAK